MAGNLTPMAARHGAGWIVIVSLVLYIVASNVVIVRADKIDIPDEVLDLLRENSSDANTNWCSWFPNWSRCENLTVGLLDDDVQLALQKVLMDSNVDIDWCRWWILRLILPSCRHPSSPTTSTSVPTVTLTTPHDANVTTARPMTSMTSITPTRHVPTTNQTTAAHVTTTPSSTQVTDQFSYKWFFIGFAVMLALVLVLVALVVIVRKVRRRGTVTEEPAYSPL